MSRARPAVLAGGLALGLVLLAGCAGGDPDPAAIAKDRDHGLYSGPLQGKHELLASTVIPNPTDQRVRLVSATPTNPYNIRVVHAWAGPLTAPGAPSDVGILGVLRWPRESDDGVDYGVLEFLRPVEGFTIPPHAGQRWMVTLVLRQQDASKSMRADGTTITYAMNGHEHTVSIPTGLCFVTAEDAAACPDSAR